MLKSKTVYEKMTQTHTFVCPSVQKLFLFLSVRRLVAHIANHFDKCSIHKEDDKIIRTMNNDRIRVNILLSTLLHFIKELP